MAAQRMDIDDIYWNIDANNTTLEHVAYLSENEKYKNTTILSLGNDTGIYIDDEQNQNIDRIVPLFIQIFTNLPELKAVQFCGYNSAITEDDIYQAAIILNRKIIAVPIL